MTNCLKIFENTDKFYALTDSALSSMVRFLSGIAIARIGGSEAFAIYVLLIMANVIFLQIPNTCYLTPLLNCGTGAPAVDRGALLKWAHRGVERAAMVFLFIMTSAGCFLPQLELSSMTLSMFTLATTAQLFALFERTHLQMRFEQRRALTANLIGSCIHIFISGFLWMNRWNLLEAFWFGLLIGAAASALIMRVRNSEAQADSSAVEALIKARSDGLAMLSGSLANSACSRAQPFLLAGISTTQNLAYYGVIWSLIGPIRLLSMALTNLLRPRLALHHNTGQPILFQRTLCFAFFTILSAGISASFIAALIGPSVIKLLFGQDLTPAGRWLAWGMLYATLDASTTCQMIALQIKKDSGSKVSSRLRIHAASLSIISLAPLTLTLGLSGVFLSLILAETYYAITAYIRSK